MSTVGPGVREIRIQQAGEFRVLDVANLPEAVYVPSAFERRRARHRKESSNLPDRLRSVAEEPRRQRR